MTPEVQWKPSDEEIIRIARGAIGDFPWHLTRESFVQAVRAVLDHAASELAGAEPVAWSYELAGSMLDGGQYGNWRKYLAWSKPNVPEGAIRNLKALCEQSFVHGGARGLKLGGYSREDIEAIADGLDCYDRTVNVGHVQGAFDELIPSTTAAAAKVLRAIFQDC